MMKVGLTGNIGSGKSTVCRVFEVLGVPVFYADQEARKLYERRDVKEKLVQRFGKEIYNPQGGALDKKRLAELIFSDKAHLEFVNGLIHPLVFERTQQWLDAHADALYTLHESAILFENGLDDRYDIVITVSAPKNVRLERILQRDGLSKEEVLARMANQLSEAEKAARADFVIENDGKQLVIPQVLKIHKQLQAWNQSV